MRWRIAMRRTLRREERDRTPRNLSAMETVAIVIPTKNRSGKLEQCLRAIDSALAGTRIEYAYVCDSSTTEEMRRDVARVCSAYSWSRLSYHNGKNVAAARNACARAAQEDLLINIDDDVYVTPNALSKLISAYDSGEGRRVVAGSVAWGDEWSRPRVMRRIGYGRSARAGERPSFLVGAFFIYLRQFAITWPWNERIRTSDDRFMGAVWRSKGVALLFEPDARAFHDSQHVSYDARDHHDHIYANLFDTLIANKRITRALSYEFLGFAAGLRRFSRSPKLIPQFVAAWYSGNIAFIRDWSVLRSFAQRELPPTFRP